MHTTNRTLAAVAALTLGFVPGGGLSAQLASASSRTVGLGGATTATAQRLEAIAVNPAGLGMPGAGFSLSFVPVTVRQGLGPVTLADLAAQEGTVVSNAVKEQWLDAIAEQGTQSGTVGAEVTPAALTIGRFGFQLTTLVGGNMAVSPDIAEVILYGNAGRSGAPADLSLSGSTLEAFAVTTAGFSLGLPIPSEKGAMAVGATLKYSLGHVLAVGQEQGGALQADPIKVNVNFPMVTFDDESDDAVVGSGVGLDVGFQMQRDRLRFGAAVHNLLNTFAWDDAKLVFRAGTASLEQGSNETDFDRKPYASAPAALRTAVDEMTFDPALSVGVAYDLQPDFTLAADVRNRFGDGMSLSPKLHAGLGAEYRGLGALHLRGGAALVTDGFLLSGGAGLQLGPVTLGLAGGLQTGEIESTNIVHFSLGFGAR